MEMQILVRTEVVCLKLGVNVPIKLCRTCPYYRYETVGGKVICDHIPPKRVK